MRDRGSHLTRFWTILLILGLALGAGCARSPEAKKARHLERGDRYFGKERYREAIIEYRNVLQIDGLNAQAIRQIGLAHHQLGELAQAYPFLLKTQELEPENIDVRLKLGSMYLTFREYDSAQAEAVFVLEKDPKNLDALAMLAGAANTPEEVDAVIKRLDGLRAELEARAKFHLALATLYLRKRDPEATERALREAVTREPQSVEARVSLGNFYTLKGDAAQAERELKRAADLAPVGSTARMRLAEHYLFARRPEEAKKVLEEITQKAPDYLPAWRRLAELALAERKYDDSLKALAPVFKTNSADIDGLFLRGRVMLAKRDPTEAIGVFHRILKLEPRHAPTRYQLALAHLQAGSTPQAKMELKEATTVAPDFAEAVFLLARLNIQTGAVQPAIEDLERFIAKRPRALVAYDLLGTAYLAKREPAKATETFRRIVALAPRLPQGHYLVGVGLRAEGRLAEAKKAFESTLAMAPGYLEPLGQLVALDLRDKKPDAALDRVKKQIALMPSSAAAHFLLGQVHGVRREWERAETAYLKAIELEPRHAGAYVQLGNLYAGSGKYDRALARLNEALGLNPKNLGALMLSGVVYERKGDIPKAQDAYQKALALNPRFAPAANNLAILYSEHGGDKEKALQLAQTAKEAAPDDPHISDTLGWLFYQRGVYQRALSLLQESATKLPDNPTVQYHLGMAAYKAGDKEQARKALTLAVAFRDPFPGKDEAKKLLAELK